MCRFSFSSLPCLAGSNIPLANINLLPYWDNNLFIFKKVNMEKNICYLGNCLDILPNLPENSVDSIVTDPPYELGFMGKSWDNSGIAYSVPMWKECLRVLKPGGHLLSFSGTRTYHRMAVAIEDAGFEVRDMIEWCYGSGFPKSLNIGKAVDKLNGIIKEELPTEPMKEATEVGSISKNRRCSICKKAISSGNPCQCDRTYKADNEWEGWGTALKPAHEPICLARKPLAEKTVTENVLKYGTGGINIDESRVEYNGEKPNIGGRANHTRGEGYGFKELGENIEANTNGRFPANLIHDNSEEVRECFPDTVSSKRNSNNSRKRTSGDIYKQDADIYRDNNTYSDQGNASRFFKSILYYPKASRSERNKGMDNLEYKPMYKADGSGQSLEIFGSTDGGRKDRKNNHPTVKPTSLMSYLIKMITHQGGIVLDPFAGSGSTLVAAKENKFNYIGIELTEDYLPIIQARTGCEIIKNKENITVEKIEEPKKSDNKDNNQELNNCPKCKGKLRKTPRGMTCEDCLEDFNK